MNLNSLNRMLVVNVSLTIFVKCVQPHLLKIVNLTMY